jgi:Spy/CpxP family protein refolding chaperone
MKIVTIAAAATLLLSTAAFAQTPESNRTINNRKFDQQQRIGQGVRSGQLTPRETQHLEHQEGAINREEHAMRAADNGHLTRSDRRTLHAQQNQESRRIYRDKHNGRVD